jgi:hypothetical protein
LISKNGYLPSLFDSQSLILKENPLSFGGWKKSLIFEEFEIFIVLLVLEISEWVSLLAEVKEFGIMGIFDLAKSNVM